MHYRCLYLLKNETLNTVHPMSIIEDFYSRFCYGCGENSPKYSPVCDWFQIGGRWVDTLEASKGYHGEPSFLIDDYEKIDGHYSVVEIKDSKEILKLDNFYYLFLKSKYFDKDYQPDIIQKYLDKINDKKINGVLVLLDIHD